MNALFSLLEGAPPWFSVVLRLSLQAAILAAIVFVVIKAVGRWIPPAWRALLWFVVIARVLVPISPPSALSLQNLYVQPPSVEATPAPPRMVNIRTEIHSAPLEVFAEPQLDLPPEIASKSPIFKGRVLAIVWAVIAAFCLAVLFVRYAVIRRHLALKSSQAGDLVIDGLSHCRKKLRVKIPIHLVVSDRIAAPALTGLFPARLIIPGNFTEQHMTAEQVRHVLMHELAHLNQGHLILHWLSLIARALHWFNPIIHFAAARLREECELAADAAALRDATSEERSAYGETILKVLSQTMAPSSQLALGMAEQARHMEQRLRALAVPPARSFRWLGALAVSLLSFSGLSGADQKPPVVTQLPNASESKTRISENLEAARVMVEERRFKEAESLFGEVLKADPKNAAALNYLHTLQKRNGREGNITRSQSRNIVSTPVTMPNAAGSSPLYTRTYRIDSRLFLPLLGTNAHTSNLFVPFSFVDHAAKAVANQSVRNRPVDIPLRPQEPAPPNGSRLQTITNSSGGISLATVSVITNLSPIQKEVRAFFGAAGLDFATNPPATTVGAQTQKALFYNDRAGVLYVRANLQDLDKVERALHSLNAAGTQMMFEVRVFNMSPDVALDLFTNLTATRTIITTNEYLFAAPKGAPGNEPQLRDSKEIVKNLKVPVMATINTAQSSEYVVPNREAKEIMERLSGNPQVESLTLPKLTTAVGRL
jgi:beta-lactamase regulating signal transducer with metallopeptidase domain